MTKLCGSTILGSADP